MFILNLGNSELGTGIALDHDRKSGERGIIWVVIGIWLVYEDDSLSESRVGYCLLDFGVVFVNQLALGGYSRVDISVGVIDI
jgi:hypothetical protein